MKNELIKRLVWVVTYFMRRLLFEAVVFRHCTILYFSQEFECLFQVFPVEIKLGQGSERTVAVKCSIRCSVTNESVIFFWERELLLSFLKHLDRYQISSFKKKRRIILGHMGEFGSIQNIPFPLRGRGRVLMQNTEEGKTWVWPCLRTLTCQTNCCH